VCIINERNPHRFSKCPVDGSNLHFPSHCNCMYEYVTHQLSHHEPNEGIACGVVFWNEIDWQALIHKMCSSLRMYIIFMLLLLMKVKIMINTNPVNVNYFTFQICQNLWWRSLWVLNTSVPEVTVSCVQLLTKF